jgi:hypothetical protein
MSTECFLKKTQTVADIKPAMFSMVFEETVPTNWYPSLSEGVLSRSPTLPDTKAYEYYLRGRLKARVPPQTIQELEIAKVRNTRYV